MSVQDFDSFFQRLSQGLGIGSQSELARVLGVNRSAVTQAKQRNAVPQSWLFALARRFGVDPVWLETGRGAMDGGAAGTDVFLPVPKVQARLSAGGGSFEVEAAVEDALAFRAAWLHSKGNPRRMVLMEVMGDSMVPLIEEGDTVLIDQSQTALAPGKIYALGLDDAVLVKRVQKHADKLVLASANPDYGPIELQGDEIESLRVIGALIWVCRELA